MALDVWLSIELLVYLKIGVTAEEDGTLCWKLRILREEFCTTGYRIPPEVVTSSNGCLPEAAIWRKRASDALVGFSLYLLLFVIFL